MSTAVGGKAFWGRARVILGVLAAAVFSTLVLVGCGKDDDDDWGRDSRLVLPDGEAWIADAYGLSGYIFQQNGNAILLDYERHSRWEGVIEGNWSTSGNQFKLVTTDGYTFVLNYSVSDNNLTLTYEDEDGVDQTNYTRRSGINVTMMSKSREGERSQRNFFKK
jgi:hypothetical protein